MPRFRWGERQRKSQNCGDAAGGCVNQPLWRSTMIILPYNPTEIQSYLTSLGHVEAGGCTEVRILPKENYLVINRKREYVGSTVAGYYTDYEKAARDIAPFDGKA